MSMDFEERLRADMGRVQVLPRPGLARDAHRRYTRSRRRTAIAVAATGTAAAVAGATAGFALTTGTSGNDPIETTAYVVNHVSSALAATDTIGYSVAHLSGADTSQYGFMADRAVEWEFRGQSRELFETPAGRPLHDISARPEDGQRALSTVVGYPSRAWMRSTVPTAELYRPSAASNNLCKGNVLSQFVAGLETAADWKQIIQSGFKCGAFTVAGRQRVDGVNAIKLTGRKSVAEATIWVDPSSYLPVRLTDPVQLPIGGAEKLPAATLTIDFRWLAPTRANLRELTAPIPKGFHRVDKTP